MALPTQAATPRFERLDVERMAASLGARMRRRRWELLAAHFPEIEAMRVLDVGGYARAWSANGLRPWHLSLLNVDPSPEPLEPWMASITGDACDNLDLGSFDLVFCNSVIEHVGGHWRRQRLADLITRSAPRFWVQTPYRYFPLEPHFLIPGMQHLPLRAQARIVRHWPLGAYRVVKTRDVALRDAMGVELLSHSQMRAYFPDAELIDERVGPLTKSIVAVRGGTGRTGAVG